MIVDIDYMRNESGFAIECEDTKIEKAIGMGEVVETSLMLGSNYPVLRQLAEDDPYNTLITGGLVTDVEGNAVYTEGARQALACISFAWLLSNNIASTTFGSVRKTDDYSENVDPFAICRQYYAIGKQMLRTICESQGWKMYRGLGYFMEVV